MHTRTLTPDTVDRLTRVSQRRFIQEQQITGYQPLKSLFCVTATYELGEGRTVPFFDGTVVAVHNYANLGQVNGPLQNKNNMTLCAYAQSRTPTRPSIQPARC